MQNSTSTTLKNILFNIATVFLIGIISTSANAQCPPAISTSLLNPTGSRISINTGVDAAGSVVTCIPIFQSAEPAVRVGNDDFSKKGVGIGTISQNCEIRYENSSVEAALPLDLLFPVSGDICSYATSGILPVEINRFEAVVVEETAVALNWTTEVELNNSHFEIMRSSDGKEWETVDLIEGAGTTNMTIDYQFLDRNPTKGGNYYLLKQVDYDYEEELSDIVYVEIKTTTVDFDIYPNPAHNILNIKMPREIEFPVELILINASGSVIDYVEISDYQNVMDVSDLENGFYILQMRTERTVTNQRFLKH